MPFLCECAGENGRHEKCILKLNSELSWFLFVFLYFCVNITLQLQLRKEMLFGEGEREQFVRSEQFGWSRLKLHVYL